MQDVAVGRIAGLGDDDAVARVEGGEEGQDEGAGGADGHGDLRRIDRHTVGCRGSADRSAGAGPAGRAPRYSRSRRSASAAVAAASAPGGAPPHGSPTSRCSTSAPRRRPGVGGRHHLHHDEGRDGAAPRGLERRAIAHVRLAPWRRWRTWRPARQVCYGAMAGGQRMDSVDAGEARGLDRPRAAVRRGIAVRWLAWPACGGRR